MKTPAIHTRKLLTSLFLVAILFAAAGSPARAHCDTMNGPVVKDARRALETGDIQPVLKWVPAADEAEVTAAFERARDVRGTSEKVREMADMYFFETVVRIHRMSEGVGYTGLKPAAAVAPSIAAADLALETGSVDALADLLTEGVREAITERFAEAYAALQHAEHNVEAGRAFVAAYVTFTHFAEEIDAAASHGTAASSAGTTGAAPEHAH